MFHGSVLNGFTLIKKTRRKQCLKKARSTNWTQSEWKPSESQENDSAARYGLTAGSSWVCVRALGSSGFLPQSKDMNVRLTADSWLMWMWVWLVICLYISALPQMGNLFTGVPAFHLITAGLALCFKCWCLQTDNKDKLRSCRCLVLS